MRKTKLLILICLLTIAFLFGVLKPAHANILDDVVDGVKNFLFPEKKELTIDSDITLAPGGDVDNDGKIDAGDIIRFSYSIKNTTDEDYSFETLRTNINRKQLNYIHNVVGASSYEDDGKTIAIPYITIGANQTAEITFDARINYFSKEDPLITTEAELVSEDDKFLAKSEKKEITAKRIDKEKIPSMLKQVKQENIQE